MKLKKVSIVPCMELEDQGLVTVRPSMLLPQLLTNTSASFKEISAYLAIVDTCSCTKESSEISYGERLLSVNTLTKGVAQSTLT